LEFRCFAAKWLMRSVLENPASTVSKLIYPVPSTT
jgi:hypothetical protein